MVNEELVKLIQDTADYVIANYTETIDNVSVKIFKDYTCVVHNEIDYQFQEATPYLIEASLLFGSATKNNDLEKKYSQNFVINIQSEINGGELAKKLFNEVFKALTRKYKTLGNYSCKIFLTSPVITNPFNAIESDFRVLMTMNGTIEIAEDVVLGATYSLSLNGSNYVEITPRQPYSLKEAVGGTDIQVINTGTPMLFTKSSDQMTINIVLIYELDGDLNDTTHDTLFNSLLNECYGSSSQKYYFKCELGGSGGTTKTFSNLICIRGQHIYDEATGENVLSLQFKVGA